MATIATFAAFSSKGYSFAGSTAILPTGGDYVIDNSALGKRVHVFTSPGTFTIPANATLNSPWTEVEVLLVGGGGNALACNDTIKGSGGGGGGGIVYDSSFRLPKGFALSVEVGNAGDSGSSSRVPGLPAAMGGGAGGNFDEYSKGGPGGTGGGGSWQNGAPNGPFYTVANPGWTYGNTGPSAPTNTQYFMPVVLNQPSETPSNVANTLAKTWSTPFHEQGNGQYGCTSATPDSSKGLPGPNTVWQVGPPGPTVNGLAYSSKAFRMRGGGGAGYAGGIGGQGVLTDFTNKENGSYIWVMRGGHGEAIGTANNYDTMVGYSGVTGLRDSGVFGGTYYPPVVSNRNPAATNWLSDYDNLGRGTMAVAPAGADNYGSAGSTYAEENGTMGVVILRYDLNAFPGGAPAAVANVFGGSISTSANGRFRYHIWNGNDGNSLYGTSANSQGYVAFNNPDRHRLKDNLGYQYTAFNVRPGANTDPFYFYRDVPSFPVQYMIIGGGGSTGTKGNAVNRRAWLVGGGGAGSMQTGTFSTPSQAPNVTANFPSLGSSLANSASGWTDATGVAASQDFGYMQIGAFQHRPGYVEVYANSLLNPVLDANRYVDSAVDSAASISRQNSTLIRIRGSDNSDARLLQRDYHEPIYNGYLGDGNGTALYANEQNLVLRYNNVGWPTATYGGNSIYLNDTYDHYFYSNYVRARAGRRGRLHVDQNDPNSSPTNGTADTGNQVRSIDRTFTLGSLAPFVAATANNFSTNSFGTHAQTGEVYYNAIKFNQPLCAWSKAADDLSSDRWSPFYNRLNSFNASYYGTDTYPTPTPANPSAVTRIPLKFTDCGAGYIIPSGPDAGQVRNVYRVHEFRTSNSSGTAINNQFSNLYGVTRNVRIQYVEECCNPSNPNFGKRRFQYIDTWGGGDFDLGIEADWKLVSAGDAQIATTTDESDTNHRTFVQVWKRSLRRIYVRQLYAYDINAGNGGKGNRVGGLRRRSGGTSSIHNQDGNTPLVTAGGGGAGGFGDYESSNETYPAGYGTAPGEGTVQSQYLNSDLSQIRGVGIGTSATNQGQLTPAGSGGGPAWYMERLDNDSGQYAPVPGSSAGPNGSGSPTTASVAGSGSGGGSINVRDWDMGLGAGTFKVGGATRGSGVNGFSQGRQARRSLFDADSQHGGRGYFGSGYNWSYFSDGAVNLSSGLTYFHLNINQFPHNAIFASGGGGGAGGNGGDGSSANGGTGGNGADGAVYNLNGYPTVYGAGGGGFGRRINGSPGSGMPADPSTVSPAGSDGPAYTPYGIGGGWSPGKEEGGGPDGGATKYYTGSGPWPSAYPVSPGVAHMDAMRYAYSSVPADQKGDIGTRYDGRKGVVIIAYSASPYFGL